MPIDAITDGTARALDLATALWLGVVGACIGSFLNVVAYRMPRGMSVVWKPSHCPRCGRDIRPRDNVPVLGWLLLRGRCRDCGQPISPRYAVVEAVLGGAFLALAYLELFSGGANLPGGFSPRHGAWQTVWNPDWPVVQLYAFHSALLSALLALGLIDQDGERAPPQVLAFAAAALAVAVVWWPHCYPERWGPSATAPWSAAGDALLGGMVGAGPWIAAALWGCMRGKQKPLVRVLNPLAAGALAGATLGGAASGRLAIAWLIALGAGCWLRLPAWRGSPLLLLWLLTLGHILFWDRLATLWPAFWAVPGAR